MINEASGDLEKSSNHIAWTEGDAHADELQPKGECATARSTRGHDPPPSELLTFQMKYAVS